MLEVLLVEDCEADVLLVEEAVATLDVPIRLHHVHDGAEALAFLRHEPGSDPGVVPSAVLLDANTPRRTALEVLTEVRTDPALRTLKVVVFSSSAVPRDVEASLAAGADAYVTKPLAFDAFIGAVQDILRGWAIGAEQDSGDRED